MRKLSLILFTGLLAFGFTENALTASAKADTIKSESITFKGGRPVMLYHSKWALVPAIMELTGKTC